MTIKKSLFPFVLISLTSALIISGCSLMEPPHTWETDFSGFNAFYVLDDDAVAIIHMTSPMITIVDKQSGKRTEYDIPHAPFAVFGENGCVYDEKTETIFYCYKDDKCIEHLACINARTGKNTNLATFGRSGIIIRDIAFIDDDQAMIMCFDDEKRVFHAYYIDRSSPSTPIDSGLGDLPPFIGYSESSDTLYFYEAPSPETPHYTILKLALSESTKLQPLATIDDDLMCAFLASDDRLIYETRDDRIVVLDAKTGKTLSRSDFSDGMWKDVNIRTISRNGPYLGLSVTRKDSQEESAFVWDYENSDVLFERSVREPLLLAISGKSKTVLCIEKISRDEYKLREYSFAR